MVEFSGSCVIFKSDLEFYEKEAPGLKSNTIRLVSPFHHTTIKDCNTVRIILKQHPCWSFERWITDISKIGTLAGKDLIVISWDTRKWVTKC